MKQSDPFNIDHIKSDIKIRAVRSGAITLSSQAAKFIMELAGLAILARLLLPGDFGLIAMVSAVIGFPAMFKDAGLSMATVQKEKITHKQVSTLFWVNVGISVFLFVVIITLSPLIAFFYSEPKLQLITICIAAAFLFDGLGIQHQALLRRQMRFERLAAVNVISQMLGLIIAIVTAWIGWHYWALVIKIVTSSVALMFGLWIAFPWFPGLPERHVGTRDMVTFGGFLTLFNVMNYLARNIDNLLIGWYWGASLLGLYSRSYSLLLLPINQINAPIAAVAVPTLSRLQNEPALFRSHYLAALSIVAFITAPIAGFVIALARPIIMVILGSRWEECITILQYLSISIFIQPCINTVGWIYTSLGQSKRMVKWGLMVCPVIIISFAIGLPFGPEGVSLCYSLTVLAIAVPAFLFASKNTLIDLRGILQCIWKQIFSSISSTVIVYWLYNSLFAGWNYFMSMIVGGICFFIIYFIIDICILKDVAGRERSIDIVKTLYKGSRLDFHV